MLEQLLGKMGWAVLVASGAFFLWAAKGLVTVIIDNRDKLKVLYLKDIEHDKEFINIKDTAKVHEFRIDKNEKDINTIIVTHNNSCSKHPINN